MNRKWFSIAALMTVAISLLSVSSCGHDQKLVSIALQPSSGFVFEGPNATGQFTAYGTYIHPPETKDITDQVAWTINIANFATISQSGLITYTRTDGCGSGEVTASVYNDPSNPSAGSVVTASAPVSGGKNGTAGCQ
jgi:hypothetical protein